MSRCVARGLPGVDRTENEGFFGRRGGGRRPSGVQGASRSSILPGMPDRTTTARMTHDELVELSDLNFADAFRDLSRRAGGPVLDEDGLMLYTGGHPLPVLVNGLMRTDRRLDAPAVLARARAFFAERRRGFTVIIRPHAGDADLAAAAAAAGLGAMGDMPAMV